MACGGTAAAVAASTPASWVSSASVVLLRPRSGLDPTAGNPYLGFGDNLQATADVLTTALRAPATARALVERGATAGYHVEPDPDAPGSPVLQLRAAASVAGMAVKTRDALVGLLHTDLATRQLQAGSPSGDLITASVVTAPPAARDTSDRTTVAVAGGLGSLAVTAGAVGAVTVSGRRSGSRRRRPGSRPSVPAAAPYPPASSTGLRS